MLNLNGIQTLTKGPVGSFKVPLFLTLDLAIQLELGMDP